MGLVLMYQMTKVMSILKKKKKKKNSCFAFLAIKRFSDLQTKFSSN